MKRISGLMVAVIVLLQVATGVSWAYEAKKTAGSLNLVLSIGSYPLVKGDNTLSVKVTDGAGKAVTDAKVSIRFYMPPMPGMAPMSSTMQAVQKNGVYQCTANASMEGTWKAEVSVTQPGKKAESATFNLDAR